MNSSAPADSNHRLRPLRVAYMMSRFPKITETFILYEMLALEREGIEVDVSPLRRERTRRMHQEAVSFVERAHFLPLLSLRILRDNLAMLTRRPRTWLSTLGTLIRANWGSPRYLLGALAAFPKCVTFSRLMQENGIDHVHAHFASHPAAAAWIIHQFTGIPYSFAAHGSDLHRDRHMLAEKVHGAAFVVAISEYNRNLIVETVGEEVRRRVKVIHCGIDADAFAPRRSEDTPADRPVRVFCVGTLHEVKGQAYLIRAANRLGEQGRPIEVHLVGDGPDGPELERLATDSPIRVVFHGHCTRDEVIELLHTADLVAAPSVPTADGRREGIPVALMEAMAVGLPVVASRLSGIPELVCDRENGLLVEPRDVAGLTEALRQLCDDEELRKQYGTRGRETVQREFDLQTGARLLIREISAHQPARRHSKAERRNTLSRRQQETSTRRHGGTESSIC